jgi:hypothetical protein
VRSGLVALLGSAAPLFCSKGKAMDKDPEKNLALEGLVFRMERDAILRELDVKKMENFMRRNKQKVPKYTHPTVPYALMHNARLQVLNFSPEEKLESAMWLRANNYSLPKGMKLVSNQLGGVILTGAEYSDDR